MIDLSCHCGAIRYTVETAPAEVNDCDCSLCRRYGTLWAYYRPSQVTFSADNGATEVYMWGERRIEFHRCRSCGCITHWSAVDRKRPRMGVNARMMPPETLAGVTVLRNGRPAHSDRT